MTWRPAGVCNLYRFYSSLSLFGTRALGSLACVICAIHRHDGTAQYLMWTVRTRRFFTKHGNFLKG